MNNLLDITELNRAELIGLSKLNAVDLIHYLGIRRYLIQKYGEPKGFVSRFDVLKIIGLMDVRSSYNVVHRFRKGGIAEVIPSGRKGIWINLVHAYSSKNKNRTQRIRTLKVRPGEKISIQVEGV